MSARWLVTGAEGMLGVDLVAELRRAGHDVTAVGRQTLDVTDAAAVEPAVVGHDLVVNAAAYTDVDGAEADEDRATLVNGTSVGHLATACRAAGTRLVQVSTDYVLPGTGSDPYPEDTPTGPVNAYGRSKLVGERAVLAALPDTGYVVRTAWLYGEHGRNFVATMLRLAAERDSVEVVDDQRGQPTWTRALAVQLVALGEAALAGRAAPGVYHGTAAGEATWYELARAVFSLSGLDPNRVRPTTSDRFPRPATRPTYSVLSHAGWVRAGLASMSPWHEMLANALDEPGFIALRKAAA
ncbi:MAG: dTDP-4-dehydrorhamnose reductase [Pseudonocardiales bacterium]|nr:dTDP-4-dehydrorhamnose reductase [Pseudonocardiales bacterium]